MKIAGHFVDAIKSFGYTAAEARFLYIVATHSGYFTTRHFLAFTDSQRGFRTRALTKKLLENKHANSTDCLDYGRVYHVFSKPFYAAIGKENLRNRRAHSFHHVTARLLEIFFADSGVKRLGKDVINAPVIQAIRRIGVFVFQELLSEGPGAEAALRIGEG